MSKFWYKKVEWRTSDVGAGAGTFVDFGQIQSEASHTAETAQEETAGGIEVYGGTQDVYEIPIFDTSKKADLRTEMLADRLIDLRFTDAQDNTVTEEGFSIIVSESKEFTPRTRAKAMARCVKSRV